MRETPPRQTKFSFGVFEVDPLARELRKNGRKLKLEPMSFNLLLVFLDRQGEAIHRDELKTKLWPTLSSVPDTNLGKQVQKIREKLGDSEAPYKFIETVPTIGYRFKIQEQPVEDHGVGEHSQPIAQPNDRFVPPDKRLPWRKWLSFAAGLTLLIAVSAGLLFRSSPAAHFAKHDQVLIADFENQTGEARFDGALLTAFTVSLEQSRYVAIFPRALLSPVLKRMGDAADSRITSSRGLEICRRESIRALVAPAITRAGQRYQITAQLVEAQSGKTVRSYLEQSDGPNELLPALAKLAARLRQDLGESLASIREADQPLPQVSTPSLAALKSYAEGNSLWRHNKYADALAQYRLALDADPDFAMAHAALGNANCSYVLNKPDECKREYEKALSLASRATDRERMRIRTDYASGLNHAVEAESLIRSYLSLYDDDLTMISNYGYFLRTHKRDAEAIAQYQRLIRIAPSDTHTYINLATCFQGIGDYPNSLKAYDNAFRLDPSLLDDGILSREYGFTLVAHGEEPKAQAMFEHQVSQEKTKEAGLRSLALLDVLHGRCASARSRFQDALTIDEAKSAALSAARLHLWLAYVSDLLGDSKGQKKNLDAAARTLPSLGTKMFMGALIGDAYARAGAISAAQKVLQIIERSADVNNRTDMSWMHFLKAEVAALQKQEALATDQLRLSLQEDDQGPVDYFDFEALAFAAHRSANTADEIANYEKLLTKNHDKILWEPLPRWLNAHYSIARAYVATGEQQKARAVLDELLMLWKEADPGLPLLQKAQALRRTLS